MSKHNEQSQAAGWLSIKYPMKQTIRFALLAIALSWPLISFGFVVTIPITPQTLKNGNLIFNAKATPTASGADCVVTVRLLEPTICTVGASIGIYERTFYPDGSLHSEKNEGIRSVELVKHDDTYTATFSLSQKELDDANTYFIFSLAVNVMMGGQITPMPDADLYALKMKDFISK